MEVPGILLCCLLLWAIGATALCVYYDFFQDRGNRLFAVINEESAVKAVVEILADAGIKERFSFCTDDTNQTIFDDGTAFIRYSVPTSEHGIGPNAITLATHDPIVSAQSAKDKLTAAGYEAQVYTHAVPGVKDTFVRVSSDAFLGWSLEFRHHLYNMEKLPGRYRLMKK